MGGLLFEKESYKILGACMQVHRELGTGFLESVYQEALEKEFIVEKTPFKSQQKLQLYYKNEPMQKYFVADFVCYDEIIVELKAATFIHNTMEAQTINYIKSANFKLGLLVNFGERSLKWKRFINTNIKSV
jgi:GxxExxY protein